MISVSYKSSKGIQKRIIDKAAEANLILTRIIQGENLSKIHFSGSFSEEVQFLESIKDFQVSAEFFIRIGGQ